MTADEKVNHLLAMMKGKEKGKSEEKTKGKQKGKGNKGGDGIRCHRCGYKGHKAPDCWTNLSQQSKGKDKGNKGKGNPGKGKDKGKCTKGKDSSATMQQYQTMQQYPPTYVSSSSSSGQFQRYCVRCGQWGH